MHSPAVIIADIMGSRSLPDRSGAQQAIERAAASVERAMPRTGAVWTATVGDEFQAVYPTLPDALRAILLLQLGLPDGVELRFGVGVGNVRPVTSRAEGISDGPGWWAAREAIDDLHRLQDRAVPHARARVVGATGEDADMPAEIALANAYLLARDELIAGMSERTRRLVFGRHTGSTQRELAEAEGISQPAVSQALSASGASAVLAGLTALEASAR